MGDELSEFVRASRRLGSVAPGARYHIHHPPQKNILLTSRSHILAQPH